MSATEIAVQGLQLKVGSGGSPDTLSAIVNVKKVSFPTKARTIDTSNVADTWARMLPTLLEIGNPTFDIFWVMEAASHRNSVNGGSVAAGLRYLMVARPSGQPILTDFALIYPDGNSSTDAWQGYVTSFAITGNVAGAFEASVTTTGTGQPSLV